MNFNLIIMAVPSKKTGVCDSRAIYTPPCVVKISVLKQGHGDCNDGSGDAGECNAGNGAFVCGTGSGPDNFD